jgi:hypothetical protein
MTDRDIICLLLAALVAALCLHVIRIAAQCEALNAELAFMDWENRQLLEKVANDGAHSGT